MEESPSVVPTTQFQRLKKSLAGVRFKLYCSYFLSTWGGRMWSFALSVALGAIGGDLQYTAASGLVNAVTVFLLGSVIGRWVDKAARLKAARISLIANNLTVALSAGILVMLLFLSNEIKPIWQGGLSTLLIWLSIGLCACSMLTGVATKIIVTKDWVVVICQSDEEKLAEINSMMVRIDMTAYVLSPLLAGQVMSSFGTGWGCAFIAFWNIGSFIIEYYQLWAVYKACPALAFKRTTQQETVEPGATADTRTPQIAQSERSSCLTSIKRGFRSFYEGHRTYFRQPVMPAGVALACLYLTVLGFDGITIVYVISLGLPENLTALCQGMGAIMGIVGSLIYPRMRRRIGIERTGLVSLTMEWVCLLLPVASIWLPGTNFDPGMVFGSSGHGRDLNCTSVLMVKNSTAGMDWDNKHVLPNVGSCFNQTVSSSGTGASKISLSVFLLGIILSRTGLWIADLAISQIFQERVAEEERGVVNGVQNSLNNMMDMIKSILVIILPNPHTFGILIIISWISILFGYLHYCYYSRTQRGHLLPLHRLHKQLLVRPAKYGSLRTDHQITGAEMRDVQEGNREV